MSEEPKVRLVRIPPNKCMHRTRRLRSVSMLDAYQRRVGDAHRSATSHTARHLRLELHYEK